MKRRLAACMAVVVLASQVSLPSFGAEADMIHIKDERDFLLMAEHCRTESFSTGKTFYLENDLDLSGQENLTVPVMDGTFEGNGHQITGLVLTEEISDYGLFRYVGENGTIRNLTVEAEVVSGEAQKNAGIIVGSNAGTIIGCISQGTMDGENAAGGIAGKNEESGNIHRSRNEAQINGKNGTGGIVGNNEGTVKDCSNIGDINTNQKILKKMDGDGSVNISIPNAVAGLASDERANETGGIAGVSTGSISYCTNEGAIGHEHLGYETGGIVGRQSGSVSYSSNTGTVYGRKDVGGIVGYFDPYEASSYDRDIARELEEQLDELSDLIDSLSDSGEALGDHLSGNLEELSNQLKGLKNSVRDHLDDFEDLADDSQDAINHQVADVKATLDNVSFTFGLEKMDAHIQQMEKDMEQLQAILDGLKPLLEEAGEDVQARMQQTIAQYNEELQQLQSALEQLKQYIESNAEQTEGQPEGSGGQLEAQSEEQEASTEDLSEEPEEPAEEEKQPQEQQGDGVMTPVAYATVALTDEQSAQIEAAMQALQQLSADIQTQMEGVVSVLKGVPGEAENLHTSFKNMASELSVLAETLDEEMDNWEDELDNIKDDLRGRGDSISSQMDVTGDTLDADWENVSDQLDQVKDKFSDIRAVILDGFDELKNSIEQRSIYVDISDVTTMEPGDGKIFRCDNTGEIYSDSQAGGIVGSIQKEGTKDVTDWIFDYEEEEDTSDSITRHVLAAVISCKNTGELLVQNDYAGGIVGRADYGSVFSCENYGDIVSEDGKYVGGIAGSSEHTIRDSHVLCGLDGDSYVGGVAGNAEDISGSYVCAYMDMEEYVTSTGAIAGKADGMIEMNYFVDNGYGAVDDVTRSQEAEGMEYEAFLQLKEMPMEFSEFTVRFLDGEEVVWQETFSYGEELSKEDYPKLTEPEGEYAYWEEKELSPVHRNVNVHAVYRTYIPSLASGVEIHPEILLGGEFYPDSSLAVREISEEELSALEERMAEQKLSSRYKVKKVYYYEIQQKEEIRPQVLIRVLDDKYKADHLAALSENFELTGEIVKTKEVGIYLSAETTIDQSGYIVVLDRTGIW